MRFLPFSAALAFVFLLAACADTATETKTDMPTEKESTVVKEEQKPESKALPEKELTHKLDKLNQIKNSINVQGRALTEQEQKISSIIDELHLRYIDWVKQWQLAETETAKQIVIDSLAVLKQDILDLEEILEVVKE